MENEQRLDLIDRQQLLYDLGYDPKMANWVKPNSTFDCVLKSPTVDAVEVVRCEECWHWTQTDGCRHGICRIGEDELLRWKHDFCSYGERRNDG